MSHVDPDILARRALGERAGTQADDAHLPGCAHCQAELGRLAGVVTLARQDDHADQLFSPPARVWTRITRELGPEADAALQPGPALQPDLSPGRAAAGRRVPWWRRPVAAGAAGLLIGFGVAAGVRQLASAPGYAVVASITLRPLPQFPQWKGAAGIAVMERGTSGRMLSVTLRAPPWPGFYEVWLLARDGAKMISLGDLNREHTGLLAMPPGVDLADYSRIDISLQPFNGSPLHSSDSVVRGSLP